jgi:hypothetical protein
VLGCSLAVIAVDKVVRLSSFACGQLGMVKPERSVEVQYVQGWWLESS